MAMRNVSKRFGEKAVLDDFSFSLPLGVVTCLLGPSGCGKTTLLRLLAGLIVPDAGEIQSGGASRASFVFQEDRLLPWYDGLGNLVAIGAHEKAARMAMAKVLLGGETHTYPDDMSGGMQRRLAIARALSVEAERYFLDEPLRGLDHATAMPVLDALREALRGKTGLLITHSAEEAMALGQRLLLVKGPPLQVVKECGVEDFADVEALKRWMRE